MLENLFGSKTRVAVLRAFFRSPENPLYVRELTRAIGAQINAVRRELDTLVDMGLLRITADGPAKESAQKKFYSLVPTHPLYLELYDLVMKGDVVAHESLGRDIAQHGGSIVYLGMSGVFTGDKQAPTDMLIVGKLREQSIARRIGEYEKKIGASIRYTLMNEEEFFDRRHMMDKFLYGFFESKLEVVVDTVSS